MGVLSELPNIGSELEIQLKDIGIESVGKLISVGSKQAWREIKNNDRTACINRLYAIEGAIQGIRWHSLSKEVKTDLKDYYNSLN